VLNVAFAVLPLIQRRSH